MFFISPKGFSVINLAFTARRKNCRATLHRLRRVVTIAVSHGFFNAAVREEYVIDYFTKQSTVGEWRQVRCIALDHLKWECGLAKSRASFAAAGERLRINGRNGYIEVGAVVPLPQVRSLNVVAKKVRSDTVSDCAHLRWNVTTN